MIDYQAWVFWLQVGELVGLALVTVYTYLVARSKANTTAIEGLDRRVDDVEKDQAVLQNRMDSAPTHNDLGLIHDKLNVVANSTSTLAGELKGINRQLGLISDYLLNKGGGK